MCESFDGAKRGRGPIPCSEESCHCECQNVPGDGLVQVGIVRIQSVEDTAVQVTATLQSCCHSVVGILCVTLQV